MITPDDDLLIERALSSHRERNPLGEVRPSPAFHDLNDEGRALLFERALRSRALEAAIDVERFSPTVRAVLGRLPR
jgi:hypothetical protein